MGERLGKALEVYQYERLDRTVAWEKVKFELLDPEGGKDGRKAAVVGKTFRPRWQTREQRESGSEFWWTWGDPPWIGKYPYELPRLFEAVMHGERVYICEGEKDVHSVIDEWGHAATTHPTGSAGGVGSADGRVGVRAAGWTPQQMGWLAAAHRCGVAGTARSEVVIVADVDPTGLWLAARTWKLLRRVGMWDMARVRVVLPAVEEKGADISDHIAAGWSESSLVRMRVGELLEVAGEVERRVVALGGFKIAFGSGPHVNSRGSELGVGWRLRRSYGVS